MGFLRGGSLFFVCSLLLVSLIAMNALWIVSSSLEYETFKTSLSPLAQELLNPTPDLFGMGFNADNANLNKAVDEAILNMQAYCKSNPDYIFNFSNYSLSIPCTSVSQGKEAVINQSLDSVLHEIYYKEYNCDFWDCFSKEQVPTFLVSQKAHDYWAQKFYISLVIILVLAVLAFLLLEKRSNWPIVVGGLTILSSIAVIKIRNFASVFVPSEPKILQTILDAFFTQTMKVVWTTAIIGIVLVCVGFGLRLWNSEFIQNRLAKEKSDKSNENKSAKKRQKEKLITSALAFYP